MSRAVWQLGQAVRECGIALERAGARLSTDFSFTEPCESRAPAACLRLPLASESYTCEEPGGMKA